MASKITPCRRQGGYFRGHFSGGFIRGHPVCDFKNDNPLILRSIIYTQNDGYNSIVQEFKKTMIKKYVTKIENSGVKFDGSI